MHIDHTIVPSHDQEEAAKFIARMFGVTYEGKWGHFSPVKIDKLSLDFDNREHFEPHHYAFLASDEEFDAILGRIKAEGIPYGSGPQSQDDMQINFRHGGRGFYFRDKDGHSWEVITHTYV
ncbi:MAG TPA: VOC family protein [Dehalococcoidia bacterium]|nr:VOC family protein [Dehalococcoidia bacterium]